MERGLSFAMKRYPRAGAQLSPQAWGENGCSYYPAEKLHVDRLQHDEAQQSLEEAELNGDPAHFTTVVNFDNDSGGTFFPQAA